MATGVIKSKTEKRFGFIGQPGQNERGSDVFFHESALVGVSFDDLQIGATVSYDVEQAEKGPRAVNVQLAA